MDIMGKKLQQLFEQANAEGAHQIALRVDLVFGSEILHVTGHRIGNAGWTRYQNRDERIPFTHEMMTGYMDRFGWCMPARPVKQPALGFIWTLTPVGQAADVHHYSTHARDVVAVERHAQNRLFEMRPDWIGAS